MKALLDSSVLIAGLVDYHIHYEPSAALIEAAPRGHFAVAAHAFAEAYSQLTRRGGPEPFAFAPIEAVAALDRVLEATTLLGLTPLQTLDVIRSFASSGGIGARLYDKLIGTVALVHAIPAIVTWNTRHFRGLFPDLRVCTPAEYLD